MNRYVSIGVSFVVGTAVGALMLWILSGNKALAIVAEINQKYANTITAIFTVALVLVTFVYVVLTYLLVRTTNRSVEISEKVLYQSEKQHFLSRVPLLVIESIEVKGSRYFGKRRRQLTVNCRIRNIGDSPAVTVYTRTNLSFKFVEFEWKDELFEYSFIGSLKAGEEKPAGMHFETKKIEKMLEDLSIEYTKNIYRVRNNPTEKAYKGTDLVVEVICSNVHGKHFRSKLVCPILTVLPYDEARKRPGMAFTLRERIFLMMNHSWST